jgi:hypothetical protein
MTTAVLTTSSFTAVPITVGLGPIELETEMEAVPMWYSDNGNYGEY